VNFPYPCLAESAVLRTVPAHMLVPRLFSPQADDGTHRLIFRNGEDVSPAGLRTDRAALAAGCISHTVLDYTRLGVN
jgi:5'-nucleotidase